MQPTLVIMAAGMGSRYGGIKQIDPMGPSGEIILDYSVYDALKAGFTRVVFIIRKDIEEAFRERIGHRFEDRIDVRYVFQEMDNLPAGFTVPSGREKPWGTGQAVLSCKNTVNDPFVVINADDFYGASAFREGFKGLQELNADKLEGFLVSYPISNTLSPHGYVTRGVCQEENGFLVKVTERFKIGRNAEGVLEALDNMGSPTLTGHEPASMNFWGFTPALFAELEERFALFLKEHGEGLKTEYLLPQEIDGLIGAGKIKVRLLHTDESWFGVTYPEDKPAVKDALARLTAGGTYPSPLW